MGHLTTQLVHFPLITSALAFLVLVSHILVFKFFNFFPVLSKCNWHTALHKFKMYSIMNLHLVLICVIKFIKNMMTTSYYWQPEIFLKWKNKIDIQMFKNTFFPIWPIGVWFLMNCSLSIFFFSIFVRWKQNFCSLWFCFYIGIWGVRLQRLKVRFNTCKKKSPSSVFFVNSWMGCLVEGWWLWVRKTIKQAGKEVC